jgi:HPt (histidine-containing phosphotransfer) domain-containing protein
LDHRPPPTFGRKEDQIKTLDTSTLQYFMDFMGDEGKEAVIHLIALYKKDAPILIEQMIAAASQKNIEGLLRMTHTLKGSCSQIGGTKLVQLCSRMEAILRQSPAKNMDIPLVGIKQEYSRLSDALEQFQTNIQETRNL